VAGLREKRWLMVIVSNNRFGALLTLAGAKMLFLCSFFEHDNEERRHRSEEKADEKPCQTASILCLRKPGIDERQGAQADKKFLFHGMGSSLPSVWVEPPPLEAIGSGVLLTSFDFGIEVFARSWTGRTLQNTSTRNRIRMCR
jgi:hypothetical protein